MLIECGQHWERHAATVAQQCALRFLRHFRVIEPDLAASLIAADELPPQRVIEVTDVVTIASNAFSFVLPVEGMMTIGRAGTLLARDGERDIRTPYDDCVLIMPARRSKRGETGVRIGRYVD
jgi:hypothetical protein